MRSPLIGIAALSLIALVAAATVAARPTGGRANWTVQDVMDRLIDPSADTLWGSVGTVEAAGGQEHRAPKSPADWVKLEQQARKLIEGAALLKTPRPVGADGGKGLADASTPGIRSAEEIAAEIRADPKRFNAAAERLRTAGRSALRAARAQDANALLTAGAAIDGACESCHAHYWYPKQRLTLPSRHAFAAHIWRGR